MSSELTVREKQNGLALMLNQAKDELAKILPKHLTPERIIRVSLSAASRNPTLLECTPQSLIKSIMIASQLGIEPDGVLGMGHLVPFRNNKTGKMEATFIIGYRGCLDLARRGGEVATIESGVVHEKDTFEIEFGLDRKLRHIPAWKEADPGKTIATYAVATLRDGTKQFEVMSRAQIDAIKAKSKAKDYGPWVSDFDEMARKTVIKRISKTLPLSIEFREAIHDDNQREFDVDSVIDIQPVHNSLPESWEQPQNTGSKLAEKLATKRGRPRSENVAQKTDQKISSDNLSTAQNGNDTSNENPLPPIGDCAENKQIGLNGENLDSGASEFSNTKTSTQETQTQPIGKMTPMDAKSEVIQVLDFYLSGQAGKIRSIQLVNSLKGLKAAKAFEPGDADQLAKAIRLANDETKPNFDELEKFYRSRMTG